MTEDEWQSCRNPIDLLRARPPSRRQLSAVLDAAARVVAGPPTGPADPEAICQLLDRAREPAGRFNVWASPDLAVLVRCVVPYARTHPLKAWLTPTVVMVAEGIVLDRAFDRLPVLADALEDANCQDAGLLTHLRSPGPHVWGCWALEAVLRRA